MDILFYSTASWIYSLIFIIYFDAQIVPGWLPGALSSWLQCPFYMLLLLLLLLLALSYFLTPQML